MTIIRPDLCQEHAVLEEHLTASKDCIESWVQQLKGVRFTFPEVAKFIVEHRVRDICLVRSKDGTIAQIIFTMAEGEIRKFVDDTHPLASEVPDIKTVRASTLAQVDANKGVIDTTNRRELQPLLASYVCPVDKDIEPMKKFPEKLVAMAIGVSLLSPDIVGRIEEVCRVSAGDASRDV